VCFIVPIFRNRLPGETPAAPRTTPTARSPCRPAPARPAPTRSHALHANIKHQRGRGALWGALHAPPLPPGGIWAGAGAGMTWGGISEVSRFSCMKFLGVPWGLRPRRTEWKLALSLPFMLPSAHCC
jgi:hypothetical protein